ncbi:hypothetical protein GGR58DRAFT_388502 [Xylaria digitata]|nr:hypothetical protein GGR58DRAFT_388502 [Xylaria digitata]
MTQMSCPTTPQEPVSNREPQRDDPENERDSDYTQEIPARHISSTKLMAMLRMKFGIGAYEIYMMQNRFYIKAPGKLSESNLAECRR